MDPRLFSLLLKQNPEVTTNGNTILEERCAFAAVVIEIDSFLSVTRRY